jgi:chromosomal replication initiator protein
MLSDAAKLWDNVLQFVKPKVQEHPFSIWLAPTKGDSISQNTLWVKVPNSFYTDWIEGRYRPILYEALRSLHHEHLKIRYRAVQKIKEAGTPPKFYQEDASHLQQRYTFDNFVIGESNKFAHAASLAVARAPGREFNPLFIYGGVGLGKTHLLQAVGNHTKAHLSDLRVYYVGCEQFMNEMIDALQQNRMVQFKNKYRRKDTLLIDDIEFLEGKEGLQEEIFHTFNALYDDGKQIVFSSDKPPSALANLEERLVSRFQGGLVCDIKPPSFEIRIAILKTKAQASHIQVPDEVIVFIAEQVKTSIRDLEGALIKLCAFSSLTNGKIDVSKARELLQDILSRNGKEITVETIQKAVASHFNISLGALRGKRRMQSIVLPRDVAIYLSREYTALSLKEIGKMFGGRDHTTVIHAHNKIRMLLAQDRDLSDEVSNIVKLITGE